MRDFISLFYQHRKCSENNKHIMQGSAWTLEHKPPNIPPFRTAERGNFWVPAQAINKTS